MSSRPASATSNSKPLRPTSAVSRVGTAKPTTTSLATRTPITSRATSRTTQVNSESKVDVAHVEPDGTEGSVDESKGSVVGSLPNLSVSVDNDQDETNVPTTQSTAANTGRSTAATTASQRKVGTVRANTTAPVSTTSTASIRRGPATTTAGTGASGSSRPATARAGTTATPAKPIGARTSTTTTPGNPARPTSAAVGRPATVRGTSTSTTRPGSAAPAATSAQLADEASDTVGFAPITPRRTSMIGTGRPITSSDKAKSKQRAQVASHAVRLIEGAAGGVSSVTEQKDPVATQLHEALTAAAMSGDAALATGGTLDVPGDLSQDPDFVQNLLSSLKRLSIVPAGEGAQDGLSQRMRNFLASTYDPSNPESMGASSATDAIPVVVTAPEAPTVVAPSPRSPSHNPQHHRRRSSMNKANQALHQRTKSGRIALPQHEAPATRQLAGSRVTQLVAQFERRAAEANAPTLADIAAEQRRQLEAYSAKTQELTENCQELAERATTAEQRTQELEKRYTVDKADLERALQQSRELLQEATRESEARSMDLSVCKAQLGAYQQQVATLQAQVEQLQAQLRLSDKVRKHLHNQILELKGNIRVFCRVRPLLTSDGPQGNTAATLGPVFSFPVTAAEGLGPIVIGSSTSDAEAKAESKSGAEDDTLAMIKEAGLVEHNTLVFRGQEERTLDGTRVTAKKHTFTFDRVFTPEDDNAAVFSEVSQLVQSALDGYKICIFAYGQTGSGKTHTMEGDGIDSIASLSAGAGNDNFQFPAGVGITSRTVHTIFAETQRLKKEQGWKHTCRVQILEVYMDTVYTLLPSGKTESGDPVSPLDAAKRIEGGWDPYLVEAKSAAALAAASAAASAGGSPAPPQPIESPVLGCEPIIVNSANEVFALLSVAAAMRKTRDTAMNARSSRSHVLFQLIVEGTNTKTGESRQGALTLVDLAGSERVKQSQVSGRSLEEATAINQSLSALGNVIAALGNGQKHVPFRESKLTMLLQSSLGPDSKTLMLVNLSPAEAHTGESLCSLRFAAKVNACHIGVAQKNVKMT